MPATCSFRDFGGRQPSPSQQDQEKTTKWVDNRGATLRLAWSLLDETQTHPCERHLFFHGVYPVLVYLPTYLLTMALLDTTRLGWDPTNRSLTGTQSSIWVDPRVTPMPATYSYRDPGRGTVQGSHEHRSNLSKPSDSHLFLPTPPATVDN